MQKRRRNTEPAPQSKRHQGSDNDRQLVELDSNPSLNYAAKTTASQAGLSNRTRTSTETVCDPDLVVPKEVEVDVIEVDQNREEEELSYINLEIFKANRKDNYVRTFWFQCCMCEHPLNSTVQRCNRCPHECCDDCYAKRSMIPEDSTNDMKDN
jgi:hypothetical protein